MEVLKAGGSVQSISFVSFEVKGCAARSAGSMEMCIRDRNIPMKKTEYRLDEQIRQAVLSLVTKWTEKEIGFQVALEEVKYTAVSYTHLRN